MMTTHLSHADPMPPAEAEEEKRRISEVTNYIRKEALQGMSILPSNIRQGMGWFSGDWHAVQLSADAETETGLPGGAPALIDQPQADTENPVGLSGHFHHKGFLPTHDAMMMGIDLKKNILDKKLAFTARPFFGQSWYSLRSTWGSEIALDVDHRADGLPWGKIALGYIGGEDQLTDHGRGMEVHGDIDLTNGFQFTSGIRQNNASGDANYMMVKWKLNFR